MRCTTQLQVRRLGGAYGGKITPPASFAAAAAIAAQKLNRPVRLILDFHSNMELVGKRHLYLVKYQVSIFGSWLYFAFSFERTLNATPKDYLSVDLF